MHVMFECTNSMSPKAIMAELCPSAFVWQKARFKQHRASPGCTATHCRAAELRCDVAAWRASDPRGGDPQVRNGDTLALALALTLNLALTSTLTWTSVKIFCVGVVPGLCSLTR